MIVVDKLIEQARTLRDDIEGIVIKWPISERGDVSRSSLGRNDPAMKSVMQDVEKWANRISNLLRGLLREDFYRESLSELLASTQNTFGNGVHWLKKPENYPAIKLLELGCDVLKKTAYPKPPPTRRVSRSRQEPPLS